MALTNRRSTPRYFSLGLSDQQITVPQTAYASNLEKNRRSLIGRVLSPRTQDLYALFHKLTCDWGISEPRCRGRIIGNGRFQFLFEEERDLEMVLWLGPYTFNGFLVVLQRWEDEQGPEFLKHVPMWLKIRGIPIQYVTDETIREIASSMGEVMEVELDDTMVDLSSVRARVNVCVDTRLCFKKVVRFGLRGEVKVVSLRYEEIGRSSFKFKFCRNCGDMNHPTSSCTHVWVDVPDPNDPSLSPPPLELDFDGFAENNGEPGDASADVDGEQQEQQGFDGFAENNGEGGITETDQVEPGDASADVDGEQQEQKGFDGFAENNGEGGITEIDQVESGDASADVDGEQQEQKGFDGFAENNGEGGITETDQVEPGDASADVDGEQQEQKGFDGFAENNGEVGITETDQVEPGDASADVDGEQQEQQSLDGVEEAGVTQVGSEMVGTSSQGSKRKFDAEEETDDVPEKRLRGSSDATQG